MWPEVEPASRRAPQDVGCVNRSSASRSWSAITTPACNEKPSHHARRRSTPRTVGLPFCGACHVAAASAWTVRTRRRLPPRCRRAPRRRADARPNARPIEDRQHVGARAPRRRADARSGCRPGARDGSRRTVCPISQRTASLDRHRNAAIVSRCWSRRLPNAACSSWPLRIEQHTLCACSIGAGIPVVVVAVAVAVVQAARWRVLPLGAARSLRHSTSRQRRSRVPPGRPRTLQLPWCSVRRKRGRGTERRLG
jgi:hypothetical protein